MPNPPFRSRIALAEPLERRALLVSNPAVPGFVDELVDDGIGSNATAMEFAPDGRIFVAQQSGQLRVIQNGQLLATPFVTVPADDFFERGLLGIAFHPRFAVDRPFVYIYWTVPASNGNPPVNRISRFTVDPSNPNRALAGSEFVVVNLDPLSAGNHNGGAIHFGLDGKLYAAVGENAVTSNAQSLSNRLGKILRYNAPGDETDGSIPSDNPFIGAAQGPDEAIWAIGFRNPFTFAVQPGTGRIFVNDVGGGSFEEIDDLVRGGNYGWPQTEGDFNQQQFPGFIRPVFAYPHDGPFNESGNIITGGAFYNPPVDRYPAQMAGDYFFADAGHGWIRKRDAATGQVSLFASEMAGPVDLKVAADGMLYYLERGTGSVRRFRYTLGVVSGRRLFYNNSFFDGNNPAANAADDGAIATDKTALLPGSPTTFDNVSTYTRGLNGIMLDMGNLTGTPTASQFTLRAGDDDTPADWAAAPAPLSISRRVGAGVGATDRVTIVWADNAIQNEYLQVTYTPAGSAGPVNNDVFYFAHVTGEVGDPQGAAVFRVSAIDLQTTRINQFQPAVITSPYDFNRSGGIVNSVDVQIVRLNQFNDIPIFAVPPPPAAQRSAMEFALARAIFRNEVDDDRERDGAVDSV